MESDTRYRVPAVRRRSGQRSGSTCKVWGGEGEGEGGGEFADLFGRARKAGRLGWVERRRAESRTRFKRKVLRVNGAEVMPRPQQQQPSSARVLAHSLARFFRSLLFAPVLPLPRNNRRKKGGREARFLSPRGFSPLLKHTLSSCLLLLSLSLSLSSSLASFLVHFPPENVPRSHSLVGRRSFSSSTLASSHTLETARSFPRTAPITNSR